MGTKNQIQCSHAFSGPRLSSRRGESPSWLNKPDSWPPSKEVLVVLCQQAVPELHLSRTMGNIHDQGRTCFPRQIFRCQIQYFRRSCLHHLPCWIPRVDDRPLVPWTNSCFHPTSHR